MIFDKAVTCDFESLSPDEVVLLSPHLYRCGDLIQCLSSVPMTHDLRHLISDIISLLQNISCLPISDIWEELCSEYSPYFISPYTSLILNYESQTSFGKVKSLMSLLAHFCNDKPDSKCLLDSCCELLETEAIETEVVAILCSLFNGLSKYCLVEKFFCGYLVHCNEINYSILLRLAVNLPSDWWSIVNGLWQLGESFKAMSTDHNKDERNPKTCTGDPNSFIGKHLSTSSLSRRIQNVLFCLVELNPHNAVVVIEKCIITRQFPGLVLDLLLGLVKKDAYTLMFLKRILLDSGQDIRSWMSNFLKLSSSASYLEKLNFHFMAITTNLIPHDSTIPLDDSVILTAITLLRVLAAFRGFVNYNFPPELSQKLLILLTHRTVISERGLQYISYSLAFLIGLRWSLTTGLSLDTGSNNHGNNRISMSIDVENIIVTWLQRLIDEQDIFNSITQSSASSSLSYLHNCNQLPKTISYIEPLLLLAILFHTNQPGPITELISTLLGLRIPSLGRTINGWRKLFLQTVFTENMIASQVARIPITPKLNRYLVNHLPTQCMLQLLKSHAFAKNKLHTKKWIIGQVRESIRPIHPLLPELLEAHITHSFGSNTNTSSSMNDMPSISGTTTTTTTTGNQSTAYINLSLISEQELINEFTNPKCSHFIQFCAPGFNMNSLNTSVDNSVKDFSSISSEGEDFTPQLLFLYYAFFVYDYQLSARLAANRHRLPDEPSCVYSDKLWDIIPITYLLQYARAHLSDYRALYPKLLQLVTNHFPQLTMGEMMIQDELLLDPIWKSEHEPVRLINALSNSVTSDTLVIPSRVMLNQTIITCHSSSSSNSSLHGLSLFSEEQLNEAFEQVISQVSCSNEPSTLKDLSETCSLWKKLISMINRLIQSMELFGLDCLLNFGTVLAEQCPRLLLLRANCGYLSVNRKFTHSLELLWRRLHLIMPRRLELITMNRIRSNDSTQSSSSSSEMKNFPIPLDLIIKANTLNSKRKLLCSLDLRVDPVENVMSEVDRNVFRCPSVLRLFLRILESSLLASRSYWAHRLIDRVQPVRGNSTSVNTSSSTSMPAMMMTMLSSVNSNCVNGSPSTSSSPTSSTSLPTSNSNDMSNVDGLNSKFVNSPRPIDIGQQTTMISSTTAVSTSSPGITSTTGNTTASSTISSIQSLTGNKVDISPQLLVNNEDCERLCTSMLLTQDSAIVQLLLEYCLPTEEEKKLGSEISILREIRIIICTFIHSLFIAQPVLAEIIVWQTYPRALIPISAQAIPSLHICLDTVIDVFRMSGDYSKMVFCLDLVSHLAQHYNIQATLDRAAYMIDSLYHFLTVIVSTEERSNLLYECLPSLLRLGKGFPNLAPIISRLLLSVGLMIGCTLSAETRLGLHNQFKTLNLNSHSEDDDDLMLDNRMTLLATITAGTSECDQLCLLSIMSTLDKLVCQCSAQRYLYYSPELTN